MTATIVALMLKLGHGQPMAEHFEVQAVAARGLAGCRHARAKSRRQVLVCDLETLAALGLRPGMLRENVTVSGLDVNALAAGTRLQLGQAVLEITEPCEPCRQMEAIRQGLKRELIGRRGVLCRVIVGGAIKVGDPAMIAPVAQRSETPLFDAL